MLAYVGKKPDGTYAPFHWKTSLTAFHVELSDDMFIIRRETAEAYVAGKSSPTPIPVVQPPQPPSGGTSGTPKPTPGSVSVPVGVNRVTWQGDVPSQKWMNFYTKVLSKFATQSGLKIGLNVENRPGRRGLQPEGG
jgi:hypothetical protein